MADARNLSERERLIADVEPLLFAESDMRQVIAAVDALAADNLNGDLCRALETAIVACYARAFTENKVGKLGAKWKPSDPDQRKLHHELIRVRNKVYAHTDRIGARQIVDAGAMLGLGRVAYIEAWHPLDREKLPAIRALAADQDKRFTARIEEIGLALSADGS